MHACLSTAYLFLRSILTTHEHSMFSNLLSILTSSSRSADVKEDSITFAFLFAGSSSSTLSSESDEEIFPVLSMSEGVLDLVGVLPPSSESSSSSYPKNVAWHQ